MNFLNLMFGIPNNLKTTGKWLIFELGPFTVKMPKSPEIESQIKQAVQNQWRIRFEWDPRFFTEGGEFKQAELMIELKSVRRLASYDANWRKIGDDTQARIFNLNS